MERFRQTFGGHRQRTAAAPKPVCVFLYADSPCQNPFIQPAFSERAGYETKIVAFMSVLENIWNANAMETCCRSAGVCVRT